MSHYRVTYGGYIEGEYKDREEARQAFIDFIENGDIDNYGRVWEDLIDIEQID
jgi:hypothetical protein